MKQDERVEIALANQRRLEGELRLKENKIQRLRIENHALKDELEIIRGSFRYRFEQLQKDLPEEVVKLIEKNFWNLL